MPVFEYKALDASGKTVAGIVDAESAFAARQNMRSSGIFPISVREDTRAAEKKEKKHPVSVGVFSRIRPAEISMMTRQLSTLIGAGFPLVTAIDALIPQTRSYPLKRTLAQLKDAIVEGSSFAQALSHFSNVFSPIYINMVNAGESSGTLELVLERLADDGEKQQALNQRIRAALAYPLFMSVVGMIVLFMLLAFIVPSITAIFSDMNQVLPAPTLLLIRFSDFIQQYWWAILCALGLFPLLIRRIGATVRGRYLLDRLKLRLPVIGPLVTKTATARLARTLGSLLENGVSMLLALEVVGQISGNVLLVEAVDAAAKDVGKGQGLGRALASTRMFPDLYIQMIEVGEQSGQLETMLAKIADAFENEVQAKVLGMTTLLEPAMILIMGVAVGFIVLSVCLPIFEMNRLVM